MPGIIPHLIAGTSMFLIGEYYFRHKLKDSVSISNHLLLLCVCLFFSLFPDFPLGIYYIFHIYSWELLLNYHVLLHTIITPISLAVLLILKFIIKTKREPIWIMGIICILIHITMDAYIHEGGIWI